MSLPPREVWPGRLPLTKRVRANLHVNHRYLIDWALVLKGCAKPFRILDFGCGRGEMVVAARDHGLEAYGADVFYGGSRYRLDAADTGLLGESIRDIREGRLPFEDEYFDLVVSNQVLEHVEDLGASLDEIWRVLRKPTGVFIAMFPSREVIREGHSGLPLIHWFDPRSRWRNAYASILHRVGFGRARDAKPRREWVDEHLAWLDSYTVYRPRREILAEYDRRFRTTFVEDDLASYRASDVAGSAVPRLLLRVRLSRRVARVVYRALGHMVLLSEPREDRAHA